jgi:uncharacterized membrane protein
MAWVLAIVGAVLGAALGVGGEEVLGMFGGALVGALLGQAHNLRRRVSELEADVSVLRTSDAARTAAGRREAAVPGAAPSGPGERRPTPTVSPARAAKRPDEITEEFESPMAAEGAPVPADQAAARASYAVGVEPQVPPSAPRAAPAIEREPAAAVRASAAAAAGPPPEGGAAHGFGRMLRSWFTEGNVPVKLGVLVLFVGVAAALKYALDQGWFTFPIEFRLLGIAIGGLAGLALGWRERDRRPAFGLAIQGGAIGVLLLTVFAAYAYYQLLPAGLAFGLFVVLVAGAMLLAVLQDAIALAVLGAVGGFLAPVLISTGSGNHVALFSYYLLLNAGILFVAWIRPWRVLNLIGFGFTFGIGMLWGARYYRPEHFATVEPFLIAFFLFYVAITVLYALRQPPDRRGLVDGTLTFGVPLLAFPLQAAMLPDDRMGLAYSALAMAALYALLATWLLRVRRIDLLGRSFAALAVGFATLAVPLALSARWTATTWAAEGAALVWLGLRQRQWLPQTVGVLLQFLAAGAFLWFAADIGIDAAEGEIPVLNGFGLGVLFLAVAGFFISWLYEQEEDRRAVAILAFLWAWGWWMLGGVREFTAHGPDLEVWERLAWFATITTALAAALRGWIPWARLSWPIVFDAVAGIALVLASSDQYGGPLGNNGVLVWSAFFAVRVFGLIRLRAPDSRGLWLAHVAMLWSLALLFGTQLRFWVGQDLAVGDGWRYAAVLLPLIVLVAGLRRAPNAFAWPLADVFGDYAPRWFWSAGIVLAAAWLAGQFEAGGSAPLTFIPLLNPLELTQVGLLLLFARAVYGPLRERIPPAFAAGAGFVFITVATLRAVHHITGVPWSDALFDSFTAQTALTVVWSVAGVAAWIAGSRLRRRPLWLAGAILMGVVLAKLAVIDRAYVGNLAGIVSFVAVGLLLIVVGYVAPSPPREAEGASA